MGQAAEILGVTPAFLRNLGADPSDRTAIAPRGARRHYWRYRLLRAFRTKGLVDQGTAS